VNLSGVLVSGIVVDQDSGLPMAQVRVMATSRGDAMDTPSAWKRSRVRTGDDGRFQFQLEAGKYDLRADPDRDQEGYQWTETSFTVGNVIEPEIRFALSKGQSLSGRVTDPSGHGIGGLSVIARGARSSGGFAVTAADGSFRLVGLGLEPYSLTAFSDDGRFAAQSGVPAGAKGVGLALRPGGRVRVRVIGPEGSPLGGARGAVVSVDGKPFPAWRGAKLTDAIGLIELPAPTGSVEIDVRNGRLQGQATVGVTTGGIADVSVRLADDPRPDTP
jgi:hypothetical protein